MNEQLKEAVSEAIREALGGALDCGRVWSAWGVGTMSEDDFSPVADDPERVAEIANAVLAALSAQPDAGSGGDELADARAIFAEWHRQKGCSQQIINDCLSGSIAMPELSRDLLMLALAARQPVGMEPVGMEPVAWQWRSRIKGGAWDAWENGRYAAEPAPFMDVEHRVRPAAPPAPDAVPVDVLQHVQRYRQAYSAADNSYQLRKDDTGSWLRLQDVERALATHPQPAAACDQVGSLNSKLGKTLADAVQRYDQMPDWMKNIVAKPAAAGGDA